MRVVVSMDIKDGWHIYSLIPGEDASIPPTTTSWSSTWLQNRGPAYETNPIVKFDPVIGGVIGYHENRARFYQNFKVADSPIAGTQTLAGSIKYQACDARICLLPTTKKFEVPFQIEKLPPRADYTFMNRAIDSIPPSEDLLPSDASLDSALSGGILVFMLLAAVMGMTSWLTPCVFPMIPITVSYFSKRSRDKSQNLVWLAIVFCLGIVLTYTGIGILASALIGATAISNLASNPWINLGIAALFFAFALSLMGFFEFRLPFGLVNRVERFSRKSNGYAGVILMGTAFTLTAFTCTVQFVGTLLIAAAHGEWVWPVIGMLIFSSVFALPFLVLALFPVWIQSLQRKSGNWMIRLKFSIGLLELIAVTKFLSNADLVWELGMLNRSTILIVWSAIVLIVAVVILGILPIPGLKGSQFRTPRTIPAALFLTLSLYFGYGAWESPLTAGPSLTFHRSWQLNL